MESSVSATTAKQYEKDLQMFLQWVDMQYGQTTKWCTDFQKLDDLLVEYIQYRHSKDSRRGARQSCVNARAAVLLWLPNGRTMLNASTRILSGWDKTSPMEQRIPCPYEVLLLLVNALAKTRQRQQIQIAVIIWLCFDTYLRINECINIRLFDITLPTFESPASISLPKSKTGKNQSVLIRSPFLWKFVEYYLATTTESNQDRIFDVTPSCITMTINMFLRDWNIDLHITPHTFRHGGATYDFIKGIPMLDIIARGRWQSAKSATHYIQGGRALLSRCRIPSKMMHEGFQLAQNPVTIVNQLTYCDK
jgi:site-specific recombinase XerD